MTGRAGGQSRTMTEQGDDDRAGGRWQSRRTMAGQEDDYRSGGCRVGGGGVDEDRSGKE